MRHGPPGDAVEGRHLVVARKREKLLIAERPRFTHEPVDLQGIGVGIENRHRAGDRVDPPAADRKRFPSNCEKPEVNGDTYPLTFEAQPSDEMPPASRARKASRPYGFDPGSGPLTWTKVLPQPAASSELFTNSLHAPVRRSTTIRPPRLAASRSDAVSASRTGFLCRASRVRMRAAAPWVGSAIFQPRRFSARSRRRSP